MLKQDGARVRLRTGVSRFLVEHACERALQLGGAVLELQVRVELVVNQAAFTRLGFGKTAETAHSGFERPTPLTLQRRV
ncbi:GNAT family N-acetyltransferase [Pseudophaeobacter leonis]|uniref:GNAT family N-acetyltransferase n=1 Tax=Pseudophaeobacter leonis TaxID=1144477 RepID=UPI001F4D6066|nr:GNAT family N-acetyltransferase [Pseudophaeobacter leonis]